MSPAPDVLCAMPDFNPLVYNLTGYLIFNCGLRNPGITNAVKKVIKKVKSVILKS